MHAFVVEEADAVFLEDVCQLAMRVLSLIAIFTSCVLLQRCFACLFGVLLATRRGDLALSVVIYATNRYIIINRCGDNKTYFKWVYMTAYT